MLTLIGSSIGSAAILLPGPAPEQLIEGHTVFVTISAIQNETQEEEFAAAVAVLVRDRTFTLRSQRFPGVLWYDDQYLVDPDQVGRRTGGNDRFPCTGAIIAVNAGDPVDWDPVGWPTLYNATYIESYLITDPNEHLWQVDLWNTTYGTFAWTVGIRNNDVGAGTPDNGRSNCSAFNDSGCLNYGVSWESPRCASAPTSGPLARQADPGDHGMDYPCDGCRPLRYNALVYFRLDHLDVQRAPKDHRERVGQAWWDDAAGCHADSRNQWRCPDGDDSREGNSHPYNPDTPFPFVPYDGRNNHGGSDYCIPDGNLDDCHATFDVDIYYGYHNASIVRTYYVYDVVGADAPYHCHEDNEPCDTTTMSIPP